MKISKEILKQLYGLNLTDEEADYFGCLFGNNNMAIDYAAYNGSDNTKIAGGFYCAKPLEKRGLYDLYIDNHIGIPEGISKDSPCYRQFMKEKEMDI